ncbi:MAG TPA: hypothetical protein VFB19_09955 [Mycobacterium sp.]|nr:hypothetical protein [Mycobacterium sp.]
MGAELDTVLGLSMTPTAVGLVLVEGHEADGEIMDQDAFDVPTRRGATAISASEYVAGAMSRTRAIAEKRWPRAIGVTWSDDSESEASLFLKSLTDAGFDNVVAVRSPEAGEALARGIGRAVGYEQTAVCLLEPETVVVSMVDTHDGTVQTIAHHAYDIGSGLIGWLADAFDVNDWDPECLIVVGPDAGIDALVGRLERALGIPVVAPAEAELALARGAALASAQIPDLTLGSPSRYTDRRPTRRSWPLPYAAALAMLVVGVVTFVVSISLVAGMKLTSTSGSRATPATQHPAAPAPPPVVAKPAPPPITPPQMVIASPPPEAPATSVAPPAAPPTVEAHVSAPEEVAEPQAPPDNPGPAPDAPPSPADVPPPPPDAPPPVPPPSSSKPPLLTRILSHVPGLHSAPEPPAPPPSDVPPPPSP